MQAEYDKKILNNILMWRVESNNTNTAFPSLYLSVSMTFFLREWEITQGLNKLIKCMKDKDRKQSRKKPK